MRRLTMTAAVMSSLLLIAAAPACAEGSASSWWHLRTMTNPTYLQSSSAREQVFKLTVNATAGEFRLGILPHGSTYGAIPTGISISVGESPEEVVKTFEAVADEEMPSPGPIMQATARPGPNNQYETYEIKLVGEASIELSVSAANLSGGSETTEVKQISEERLAGEIVVMATNLGTGYVNPAIQPVTISDMLPQGLEAVAIEGAADENFLHAGTQRTTLECSLQAVSCTFTGKQPVKRYSPVASLFVAPYEQIAMRIWVRLTGAKTGAVDEADITGRRDSPRERETKPLTA